jgi:glucose-6-phosphate 1-dehydrogenase
MPGPATLVLSGATSDLARSKLWPALLDLAASGRLPEPCDVLSKDAAADLPARDGRRRRPLLSES